jgi:predicted transposase YbfD/YdcC
LDATPQWGNLPRIAALHRQSAYKGRTAGEWQYCISSRELTAEALLKHARLKWPVESVYWLLDARFGEGFCRIEDETVQQVLNAVRKIALNYVKTHKLKPNSKLPLSRIMFGCLPDCEKLIPVLLSAEN